jgi:periplasmic protein TonB
MASCCSPALKQSAADRARTCRILIAVAVSAFVHVLLVNGGGMGPSGKRAEQGAHTLLRATLVPIQPKGAASEAEGAALAESLRIPAAAQEPSWRESEPLSVPAARRPERPPARAPQTSAKRVPHLPARTPASASASASDTAMRSPDTTYYPIREIDIYPVPTAPLDLKNLLLQRVDVMRPRAFVELHISETGAVDAAKVLEAHPPGTLDGELTALFLAARFTPAMRDGRAVRSRVVVRIE